MTSGADCQRTSTKMSTDVYNDDRHKLGYVVDIVVLFIFVCGDGIGRLVGDLRL